MESQWWCCREVKKEKNHRLIVPYLEFLISSETRELPKLQLNTGHLCHSAVRCPTRWMRSAPANVDIRIWYLGGGLESWHKPVPNVFLKKTQVHRTKQQTKQKINIYTHAQPFKFSFTKQTEKENSFSLVLDGVRKLRVMDLYIIMSTGFYFVPSIACLTRVCSPYAT